MKRIIVLFVLMFLLVGCRGGSASQIERYQTIQDSGTGNLYQVQHFIERENINKRQELFDNPAQVSWIYCLADNGQVVFYGPVLGKVTSSTKRLEPISSVGSPDSMAYYQQFGDIYTAEIMQQDGTFGNSEIYVYWFDPNGNYYQWGGDYFLTSIPIKINESVLDIRNVGD